MPLHPRKNEQLNLDNNIGQALFSEQGCINLMNFERVFPFVRKGILFYKYCNLSYKINFRKDKFYSHIVIAGKDSQLIVVSKYFIRSKLVQTRS